MNELEKEIEKLKYELSVTIPEELKMALEAGDLADNSEFSEIIARQHFISIRLKQLIDRLMVHKTIDLKTIPKDQVGIGSMVKVLHKETRKKLNYKIISVEISDSVNPLYEEVTLNSPIGKALSNKKVNDETVAFLPKEKRTFKILELKTIHDL